MRIRLAGLRAMLPLLEWALAVLVSVVVQSPKVRLVLLIIRLGVVLMMTVHQFLEDRRKKVTRTGQRPAQSPGPPAQ
jgi:hypothetical protein